MSLCSPERGKPRPNRDHAHILKGGENRGRSEEVSLLLIKLPGGAPVVERL